MANNTTLNSELFTNLLAEAQFAAYENSVARQIVTAFDYPANQGKTLQVPVYSAVSAVDLSEGVAPSAADTNTSSAEITLGEIGTYFQITDFLRDSAQRDVISELGMNAGMAIAEKMDQGVWDLFNSFTQSVGVEDSAVTVDNIFEAVATLRSNKITGPFYCVVDPRQALSLKKELATVGGANLTASEIGSDILRGYYIGSIAGCQIFESALVKSDLDTDSDTEFNAVGAVFSPKAIGHAIRGGVVMEDERKAAARATDIMVSAVVGQTILQDSFGVKIIGSV
jgi:N4-gp56 family major capsid protein